MQIKYFPKILMKIFIDTLIFVFIAISVTALGLFLLAYIYGDIETVFSSYEIMCFLWIAQLMGFSYLFWRNRSYQYVFTFSLILFIPSIIINFNSLYYLGLVTIHYMTSIIFAGVILRVLRR